MLVAAFLFLSSSLGFAEVLPTAEDVNSLTQAAKSTFGDFLQRSFKLRMQYEFSGRFLNQNDKENLCKLARETADRLQEIAQNQRTLKKQIENYEGDDWDARFGSTGLWRKLSSDIYTTTLSKFEVDYYLALASEHQRRGQILHLILNEMDSLAPSDKRFGPNLTRGKTLALLAQTEPSYKDAAVREFEAFAAYPDIYQPTAAAIEKMKLLSPPDTNQLNILVETLRSNWDDRYLELILSLAFLQRQCDPAGFEKTVRSWPQIEDFLGTFILADLVNRIPQKQTAGENLEQISIFEAEIAAQAAWKNEAKNYRGLLSHLSNKEKFRTPLILYVTATALAESSPVKAVNLLVRASRLRQQKSDRLNVEPKKIAEQAAQLAYNMFSKDPCNCSVALDAFDNYSTIAGVGIGEEMEYLYSSVLKDCGSVEKSRELLQEIADRPTGFWSRRAKLNLILQQMQQNQEQQTSQDEPLKQLKGFILNCTGQDEKNSALRGEALNTYCRSLLEIAAAPSAQKVLDILDKVEETRSVQLDFFKAKAFQQIGELEQAVQYMVSAIVFDSGSIAPDVTQLLSGVVENIEQCEAQADDFNKMLDNCVKLAEFSNILNNRQTNLLFAEILVLAADSERNGLIEAENLLSAFAEKADTNDIDFLRCRARLLAKQHRFDEAARLWAKLCRIQESEPSLANQRRWKWWRAKYYELYCWSKLPQTQKEDVSHSIEILESSFHNVPPLWAEKLSSLKNSAAAE